MLPSTFKKFHGNDHKTFTLATYTVAIEQAARSRVLPVPATAPSIKSTCPDPIAAVTAAQITALDPTGARTRLFNPENPEKVKPGDVVLVRLANAEPVSGVVLSIRRRTPIDTAVLLRNQLTRVGVEVWIKVYSPNVTGMEVVQRATRKPRRARLFYMRHPKHDKGSVENVVTAHIRLRAGLGQGRGGRSGSAMGKSKKGQKK